MQTREELAKLPFRIATARWLETQLDIKPRTRHDYKQYIATLAQFFGALRLAQIEIGHIVEYQKERSRSAGPRKINQELAIMRRILSWAGLWNSVGDLYHRLPQPPAPQPPPPTEAQMRGSRAALQARADRRRWVPRRPVLVKKHDHHPRRRRGES